jgi:hypothetical protein
LTTITDAYSHCVVGFHVELEPPSAASVLHALHMGMASKQHTLDRFERALPFWHCHGVPQQLVLDRAREFESEAMRETSEAFRFSVLCQAPRKPWFKGVLEDWFGRLEVDEDDEVARYQWMDHKRRDSEKLPVFHMNAVNWMLTIWVIDYYHLEVHPDLRCTPGQKWVRGLQENQGPQMTPEEAEMFEWACNPRLQERYGSYFRRHLPESIPHRSSILARMRASRSSADAIGTPARADLPALAHDLVAHVVQLHSAPRSSGTSRNLRISLASPKSPVAGSPVRLKAGAPT